MDNENDTTAALTALQQCLADVSVSWAQQTTSSTQQTTSPPRTTSSANHNKACRRTTRLNRDNGQRRGRHGACHGYLRQDCRIVELQYSCNCCIETSLTHTLSRCYALPLVVALKHNRQGNRNTSRCDKGARSSRFKVVEVQVSSRMRAWCDLPRC